jgi:hypothetical protein
MEAAAMEITDVTRELIELDGWSVISPERYTVIRQSLIIHKLILVPVWSASFIALAAVIHLLSLQRERTEDINLCLRAIIPPQFPQSHASMPQYLRCMLDQTLQFAKVEYEDSIKVSRPDCSLALRQALLLDEPDIFVWKYRWRMLVLAKLDHLIRNPQELSEDI